MSVVLRRWAQCCALICVAVFGQFFAFTAAQASSIATEAALAADPVAEKRLLALSEELRCLVCQNQNIADSNAELAQDLRREIRGMIAAGKSDKEIIDFMVVRYGDFVLYRPPVQGNTLLLWGTAGADGPWPVPAGPLSPPAHPARRRKRAPPVCR